MGVSQTVSTYYALPSPVFCFAIDIGVGEEEGGGGGTTKRLRMWMTWIWIFAFQRIKERFKGIWGLDLVWFGLVWFLFLFLVIV